MAPKIEGVVLTPAEELFTHSDERRDLTEIFSTKGEGDFLARQAKILRIKKPCVLGNHWHTYREMFFVADGLARFTLEEVDEEGAFTGKEDHLLVYKNGRILMPAGIAHVVNMDEGILLGYTEEPYSGNDNKYDFDAHQTVTE